MRIIILLIKYEEKIEKHQKPEGGVSTGQSWCLKIPLDRYRNISFFFTYFVEIPLIAKIAFKVWKIGIFAIFVQFLLSGFKQNSINKKVKVTV